MRAYNSIWAYDFHATQDSGNVKYFKNGSNYFPPWCEPQGHPKPEVLSIHCALLLEVAAP